MTNDSHIQIYRTKDGETRVDVRFEKDTVWLTQRQMGEVFDTTPENVLMHLKNIYKTRELEPDSTAKDFLVVRTEGTRQVKRNLKHYNLDAVLSVRYRVNSKRGVQFRIWATQRLREYPTIESKAAHLLYFVVKNHPFTDGNRRVKKRARLPATESG